MALRLAIVGYGAAGRQIHARLARETGMAVTAVVTRDPGRRVQAAGDWPGARLYNDLASMLTDRTLYDVVVIASPTALHAEHADAVLTAGVPFIMDKPLGADAAQARRIATTASAAGVPLTVFHNRRWDTDQLTLAALIERGDLGAVHTFERRWERWRPQPQHRWREQDPAGGGLLLDLGSHLVDSATQLFGAVEAVYAEMRAMTTSMEDDVFLVLHHANHVISRLWAGSLVGAPGPRTRVLGTQGAFIATRDEEASPFDIVDRDAPEGTVGWLTRGRERTPIRAVDGEHADFYRSIEPWLAGDVPHPVDPADAVRTAEILDAARTAAREGKIIEI